MNRRKKILIIICIISVMVIAGLFSFIKFGGYLIMDENLKKEFIADIKNSPKLPERFYETYNTMYPESLYPDSWTHSLTHNTNEIKNHCACSEATLVGTYPIHVKTIDRILIINMVEQSFSQKECLDYYIKKSIQEKKILTENLFSLSDEEIISLLLEIENPSFHNKKRYPEKTQAKINSILNKLNKP